MEKKTIEQLLAMSDTELEAYLQALPAAEQETVSHELFKAKEAADVQKSVDSIKRDGQLPRE